MKKISFYTGFFTVPLTLCLTLCAANKTLTDSARYSNSVSVETKKMHKLDSLVKLQESAKQEKIRLQDSIKLQGVVPLFAKVKSDINRSKANFLKYNSYYGSVLVTEFFPLSLFPYFCGNCKYQDSAYYLGDTCFGYYYKQYIQYAVIPLVSYVQPKVGPVQYKSYRLITYYKNPSTGEWVADDTCLSRLELTNPKEGYYGCK